MSNTKKTKRKIVIRATSELAVHGLARNFYPTWLAALMEVLMNGKDGAVRRGGVVPTVDIHTFAPGQHPVYQTQFVTTVLDNGCGFTAEVIGAFADAGRSANIDRADLEGTHGLGKFAPFGMGDNVTGYDVVTSTSPAEPPWQFTVDGKNIFSLDGFEEKPIHSRTPNLPMTGPYTMVVVPGSEHPAEEMLREQLRLALPLPLVPFVVRLNNKEVPRRTLKSEVTITTPPIPALGGVMVFKFGTADIASDADKLELFGLSGRSIGELVTPASRGLLHPIFRNFRLVGGVIAPNIGKASSSNRQGLSAKFWNSKPGQALIAACNSFGVEAAKQVLGSDKTAESPLAEQIRSVVDVFTGAFGLPEAAFSGPGPSDGGRGKKKGNGTKRSGSDKSGDSDEDGEESTTSIRIKIQGDSYTVLSYDTTSLTPAQCRGKVIVVNTAHPEVRRVMRSRNGGLVKESIIRSLVEAHVMRTNKGATPETLGVVYALTAQLHAGAQKG